MTKFRLRIINTGFSLPLVLIAALVVLLGGLMLANRSSDGVISTAFQRDSSNARDAAETGMTLIIGELNRHRNRGLLAKATVGNDPDNYLWSEHEAASSYNLCNLNTSGRPDLVKFDSDNKPTTTADNTKIGFQSEAPYQTIYLNAQGDIVSNAASANKAYRLLWVKRQPLEDSDGKPLLKVFSSEWPWQLQHGRRGNGPPQWRSCKPNQS